MALFNYECDEIKRKIDEVSPNYPQLTTFEKEWLFFHRYHYIPGIPVELECETVNVNPYGMVTNAIPFRYKNAVLKGNTMVNLLNNKYNHCNLPTSQYVVMDGANTTQDSSEYRIKQIDLTTPLTVGKVYLVAINVKSMENVDYLGVYTFNGTKTDYPQELRPTKMGLNVVKYTANSPIIQIAYYLESGNGKRATFGQPMIIEYQDGMENWDIPYFEGMKSVQMPVLKTIGKNLFNIYDQPSFVSNDVTYTVKDNTIDITSNGKSQYPRVNFNLDKDLFLGKTIYCSYGDAQATASNWHIQFVYKLLNGKTIYQSFRTQKVITLPEEIIGDLILGLYVINEESQDAHALKIENIQIEYSTEKTTHEPYKSNILRTSEDVVLRGIGEVKDELNLLTGELTQRIGEIVFDKKFDNKNITVNIETFENVYRFGMYVDEQFDNNYSHISKFDKFKTNTQYDGDFEHAYHWNNTFYFFISKDKINGTMEAFKEYITNNPITFQGVLKTESVKTVDLTKLTKPYEGTNNYHLTTNIPCKAILEVPVVSTGKQTLEEINNY